MEYSFECSAEGFIPEGFDARITLRMPNASNVHLYVDASWFVYITPLCIARGSLFSDYAESTRGKSNIDAAAKQLDGIEVVRRATAGPCIGNIVHAVVACDVAYYLGWKVGLLVAQALFALPRGPGVETMCAQTLLLAERAKFTQLQKAMENERRAADETLLKQSQEYVNQYEKFRARDQKKLKRDMQTKTDKEQKEAEARLAAVQRELQCNRDVLSDTKTLLDEAREMLSTKTMDALKRYKALSKQVETLKRELDSERQMPVDDVDRRSYLVDEAVGEDEEQQQNDKPQRQQLANKKRKLTTTEKKKSDNDENHKVTFYRAK